MVNDVTSPVRSSLSDHWVLHPILFEAYEHYGAYGKSALPTFLPHKQGLIFDEEICFFDTFVEVFTSSNHWKHTDVRRSG